MTRGFTFRRDFPRGKQSVLPHRKHLVAAAHERFFRAMALRPVRIFCVNAVYLFLEFKWSVDATEVPGLSFISLRFYNIA